MDAVADGCTGGASSSIEGRIPLEDCFEQYVETGKKLNTLRPSTIARYAGILHRYVKGSPIATRPVSELSSGEVELWLASLVDQGVGRHTVVKAHSTLRAVLTKGQREGKLLVNPAIIKMAAPEERPPFFLTEEQVQAIVDEIGNRYRVLVYTLAYTGIRIGEATALRVEDVDTTKGQLHVSRNSPEVGGVKYEHSTKTGKDRFVILPDFLVHELIQHMKRFGVRQADGSTEPASFLFTSGQSKQVRQGNWRRRHFRQAARRGKVTRSRRGVDEVPRVPDLRHTAASLAAKAGYSLHEVKDMLGHSTINMTADRYLHLFPAQREGLAQKLGDLAEKARRKRGKVLPFRPRGDDETRESA